MDLHEQQYQITPAQLVQMRELSSLDIGNVAGWSRTLLRLYEPVDYHEPLEDPDAELRFMKPDLSQFDEAELTVYPNPSQGLVMLQLNRTDVFITKVEVVDVSGRGMMIQAFNGSSQPLLNLSEWADGVYLLRVSMTDGKQHHISLIIQKN